MNAYLLWHRHIFTMLAVILVSDFCCWNDSCTYSFWAFFFFFQKKVLLKEVTVVVPVVLFWRRFSSICVLVKIAQHSNWEYFWRQRWGPILRDVGFPERVYPALKWSERKTASNAGSAFWLLHFSLRLCVKVCTCLSMVSSWKSDNDWAIHSKCPNTCEDDVRMTHRSSNHK